MKFPDTEPEILALARQVIEGLRRLEAELPAPPVPLAEMQDRLERADTAVADVVVATTALRQQHAVKDEAIQAIVNGSKVDLKYAEAVFRDQPEMLSQLGWGPRRDGSTLEPPGEVRDIRIMGEGDTWVALRWNPPADGGAVASYKIQRKKKDGGWEDVGSSVDTEQMVSSQPRGIELDYRVLAVNKAGVGQPSATVTVVL
jgi:hypothetical protein